MDESFTADQAPGMPGMQPNWCDGAKQMVGTSLGPSRVWFTIGQGILNEIYYPRVDIPQVRDLGFIISDGHGFWQELKRLEGQMECVEAGIPAVTITHRHRHFTFTQRIALEPNRDALLVEIKLQGDANLRPYVLLAPHLGGTGRDNYAEAAHFHSRKVLWAWQGPFGLALAAVDAQQQDAFGQCSAGFSGDSDGWQTFNRHGRLDECYRAAGPGTVALTGELPRQAVLALGFGSSCEAAATLAISSLLQPFETVWQQYIGQWINWRQTCHLPVPVGTASLPERLVNLLKTSAMVLRTHHDQTFQGALIASLSIPWGESQEERPGYHLVWPRDLVECAGALLALGCDAEAREILRYLMATQLADGSWFQNQWLGGKPYWTGVQLDQVAFPVLLAGTLADRDALDGLEVGPMAQRALGFIATHGPISPQDRWEEDSGVNTFTLTVCIAALVSGARFLPVADEGFALELADFWNAQLDNWAAVRNTEFAHAHGVDAYYPRIIPAEVLTDDSALVRAMPIKNHLIDPGLPPTEQIGVDFLQLVRYGLRDPDDPLIRNTVKLVDKLLAADLPQGSCWRRYTSDGYGEHADGQAYDGNGIGRLWPLLTGERGHYELIRGMDALPYLYAMAGMSDGCGMLPEQVWDAADIPERNLKLGRATGSAMPLAWAHAEYIKLACSILRGYPVDRPEPVWARYHGVRPDPEAWFWSPQAPLRTLSVGKRLGFCLPVNTIIHWRTDTIAEQTITTRPLAMGIHMALLPELETGRQIIFRLDGEGLSGQDHTITLTTVEDQAHNVAVFNGYPH
ncbi:glycoside hydrolase family 15 protein [Candidatus Thiothrix sp. Deng01]|uniref:Glycoside hydrolase family 15 protein n=1 Tax=Candidatus Thiothrix phosphatis TaxID=3112415 RepID=A0ABU6D1R5_9GAMM|nr:glycoside hydrolase family 15 protein [Candidatus Thiothrix sp. Deng01]MEB4593009.1 glycoside hydrolase family 15 protein [Candidatus Thiothrix sp. Deng01]